MDIEKLIKWHNTHKCNEVVGRYVTTAHIESVLERLPAPFVHHIVGTSVEGRNLRTVEIGSGPTKVFCWSQMHGNESTGTKAVLDLLYWLKEGSSEATQILASCTLVFMPIVNPDGAVAYTRVNAQDIDLNRDVLDLKAPESRVLQEVLKRINPDYCFNLHDQRTIFSVGVDHRPATLSFLAPSVDEERTVTEGRKKTMQVIAEIFTAMQGVLPYQIGRYSDEFYPTATGDNFEKMGHHTILIEAGHYLDDYKREKVRQYNWLALLLGLQAIASPSSNVSYRRYFDIPNNAQNYLDEIHKNVYLTERNERADIGILYKESVLNGVVQFVPHLEKVGDLSGYMANKQIDSTGKTFKNEGDFLDNYRK